MRTKALAIFAVLALVAGAVSFQISQYESGSTSAASNGSFVKSSPPVELPARDAHAKRERRIGPGSVEGADQLRQRIAKYSDSKTVKVLKIHSSDGSDAGLTGATTSKVKVGNIESAIKAAEADETVIRVGIDGKVKALGIDVAQYPGGGQYDQWALNRVKAEAAWAQDTGKGVKVAVLDTGVHAAHEDLDDQMLEGEDFVEEGTKGWVDRHRHGTHVAGIVAAEDGPGGVTGLAHDAHILPIRVLDGNGNGDESTVVNGIIRAVELGADVINMSLGGAYNEFESAVNYARSNGVSVVASNGNAGAYGSMLSYPANTTGVIGVTATTDDDSRAYYSSYNSSADIAAPGDYILSTYKYQDFVGYGYMSGTSMSSPYAAATIALALQEARKTNPNAKGVDVENAVLNSTEDLGDPGRDDVYGTGLIDPVAAIAAVAEEAGNQPTDPGPTEPEPTQPTEPEPTTPTEPEPTQPTEPGPTGPTEPEPTQPTEPEPTTPTEPEPTEPEPTTPTPPTSTSPASPSPTIAPPTKAVTAKLSVAAPSRANGKTAVTVAVVSNRNTKIRPTGDVQLMVQPTGASWVRSYSLSPSRFNSAGKATIKVPISRHTRVWATTSSPRRISSAKSLVRAKAKLSLSQGRKRAKRRAVRINPHVGVRSAVRVQRKVRGKWRSVRNVSISASRSVTLRLPAATYRFTTRPNAYFVSTSKSLRVR